MGTSLALVVSEEPDLSLDLPKGQSFDDWVETGRQLASANKVLNWWIGDWWAAGNHRYGARAAVAAQGIFGRGFQSLANMASVCRAFSTSRRREHLSFSHHEAVAVLKPDQADKLLDRAERENLSVHALRAEVILLRDSHTPRWFEAKPPTRYDRDKAKEAVFDRLSLAAESGEICPTADELAEVAGVESVSTTVALMHILESEGRIKVDRFQKSRQVTIVATGQATAEPNDRTPHWRQIARDVPAPSVQAINDREPTIANLIWAAARKKGYSAQDYLAELVLLGWEVECARDDSLSRSES